LLERASLANGQTIPQLFGLKMLQENPVPR